MNNKLLMTFAAGGMMLATACSSDNVWDYDQVPTPGNPDELTEVTFKIGAQSNLVSRSVATPYIGQGSEIDMLVYAVYEYDEEEGYVCLEQYGNSETDVEGVTPGAGQTVLRFSNAYTESNPLEIPLRLMRNKRYYFAFWAQNSKNEAYDYSNLQAVTIDYDKVKNNDETMDAFCKMESFIIAPNQTVSVILQRPLAQINLGTTGADYARFLGEQLEEELTPVKYSTVTLSGAANCINVVTDEISTVNGFNGEVTYEWSAIPSYAKMAIPTEAGADNANYIGSEESDEEFLMVNLDGHKAGTHAGNANQQGYLKYLTSYPTMDGNSYKTETFKYISMCYVLVPASTVENPLPDDGILDQYYSTTLNSVSLSYNTTAGFNDDGTAINTLTLTTVPVHRNWRTNILGGLTPHTPGGTDPDDPDDDPTSIFPFVPYQTNITITMNPSFDKDYNSGDNGSTWKAENN